MVIKNSWSNYLQSFFYIIAGVNHFVNPEFYLDLIPPFVPAHGAVNLISGLVEIAFGTGLLFRRTRQWAAFGIIAMLIAFIPSHIYFIQIGGCVDNGLCAPLWVGWIRLLVIHPLLIWWAWKASKTIHRNV